MHEPKARTSTEKIPHTYNDLKIKTFGKKYIDMKQQHVEIKTWDELDQTLTKTFNSMNESTNTC